MTGHDVLTIPVNTRLVASLFWTPSGDRLAGTLHNSVTIWDASTGAELHDWFKTARAEGKAGVDLSRLSTQYLVWSPDGKRAAAINRPFGPVNSHPVSIRDPDSGLETLNLGMGIKPGQDFRGLGWSPDGTRQAATGSSGLKIWDAASGDEQLDVTGQFAAKGANALAWSPDSNRLATPDPARDRASAPSGTRRPASESP